MAVIDRLAKSVGGDPTSSDLVTVRRPNKRREYGGRRLTVGQNQTTKKFSRFNSTNYFKSTRTSSSTTIFYYKYVDFNAFII